MSVTMTRGHVLVGNESDMLWCVWWKYNEGEGHSCIISSVQTTHWVWGFIQNTFRATHVFVAGQCEVLLYMWCHKRNYFISLLDIFIEEFTPAGHILRGFGGLCFCFLYLTTILVPLPTAWQIIGKQKITWGHFIIWLVPYLKKGQM